MKTLSVNGSEYPPLLVDVLADFPDFVMDLPGGPLTIQSNASSAQGFYALGDARFNLHLGHLHWSTLFLRLHNSICDEVAAEDPSRTDQQVIYLYMAPVNSTSHNLSSTNSSYIVS